MWSDLSVWLLSTCPQMTKSHTLWRTLCWRSTMSTTVFCTSEQVCVHVYVCVIQLFVMDIPTAEGLFSLWFHSLIAPHFSHFVIQSDSGKVRLVSLLWYKVTVETSVLFHYWIWDYFMQSPYLRSFIHCDGEIVTVVSRRERRRSLHTSAGAYSECSADWQITFHLNSFPSHHHHVTSTSTQADPT